jgi:hypothetical protein
MNVVFIDIETRGTLNLRTSGTYRYANHKDTEVSIVGFAIGDGSVQHWFGPVRRQSPADPVPPKIVAAARDHLFVAHNALFDRALYQAKLVQRHDWPEIPLCRWRCTMAMALANALPGSLEGTVAALGLPIQKDREGQRLMLAMARPRRRRKGEDPNALNWIDDDASFARFVPYLERDVELVRALFNRLPPLSPEESALWQLDAVINARGFAIDVEQQRTHVN